MGTRELRLRHSASLRVELSLRVALRAWQAFCHQRFRRRRSHPRRLASGRDYIALHRWLVYSDGLEFRWSAIGRTAAAGPGIQSQRKALPAGNFFQYLRIRGSGPRFVWRYGTEYASRSWPSDLGLFDLQEFPFD